MAVTLFTVDALGDHEEHLILTAMTDSGDALPEEATEGLFSLPAEVIPNAASVEMDERLEKGIRSRQSDILRRNRERDATAFKAEAKKLEGWADDLKLGLERAMNGIDREVKKGRRNVAATSSLGDGLADQNRVIALKARRNEKRRSVSKSQAEVDRHRAEFVAQIEGKLAQKTSSELLFLVRWSLRS